MSLRDIIRQDLKTISSDLGNPYITYQGEQYECIPSTDTTSLTLEIGGFSTNADIIFNISKELFTDFTPASQEKVTYNSVIYRILSVKEDATGAFYRLICVSDTRGI